MGSPSTEPERNTDEGPTREVSIGTFAMSRYEITFDDYDKFAIANKRPLPNDQGWGRGDRPVINVSWQDARDYAIWLSDQTGKRYRLPTEAEWEYAARAGTETPFWTGNCIHTDQANYDGEKDYADCGANTGIDRSQTVATGSLNAPNPWGLHDVHGNVWEWVGDCWHGSYSGAPTDGSAWLETEDGACVSLLRGGSFGHGPGVVRSAIRFRDTAGYIPFDIGFRLAQDLTR